MGIEDIKHDFPNSVIYQGFEFCVSEVRRYSRTLRENGKGKCFDSDFVSDWMPGSVRLYVWGSLGYGVLEPMDNRGQLGETLFHRADKRVIPDCTLQMITLSEMLQLCLNHKNVLEIKTTNLPVNQISQQLKRFSLPFSIMDIRKHSGLPGYLTKK